MQNLNFPLRFSFKVLTPSNDFSVFDAQNREVAYTRQKIFKIKEAIQVYQSSNRQNLLYTINADRIIDFNAAYTFRDAANNVVGATKRAGMKSLWKTQYHTSDAAGQTVFTLHEENPMIALFNGLLESIPVISILSGYLLNPSYAIDDTQGHTVFRLRKLPSFFERKFSLEKVGEATPEQEQLALLSVMLLMLMDGRDG